MAKLFIAVAVLCVLGAVVVRGEFDKKEAMAEFMSKAEDCKKEVGAKESDLEEMMGRKPASTMEGKCLRACIMKKFGAMDASGKFVPAVAESHAEKMTGGADDKMKIARAIIAACSEIAVAPDHCQAAEEYGKCFKEQAAAHGITEDYEF